MSNPDLLNWLTVREVTRRLDMSQQYIISLIQTNRLHAIRTKLGWLVDPASVEAFEQERAAKQEKKGRK